MKLNQDMLDAMRKATSLLQRGRQRDATSKIQQVLPRVLPSTKGGAQAQAAAAQPMKDINPPPAGRTRNASVGEDAPKSQPEQAPEDAPPKSGAAVPDFVADLLQRFGMPTDLVGASTLPGVHADSRLDSRPGTIAPGKFLSASLTNAAGTRQYKLYVPAACHGQPLALVVMLHGCTQNPDDFAAGTEMNLQAELTPCLVLYPAQSSGANSSKCWNWFNAIDQQRECGEPSIIADMTRQVMTQYAVDPTQVYIAGLSAGGAMAAIMGQTYPDLYAAVGIHSGLPYAAADDLPSALQAMRAGASAARNPAQAGAERPIIVFHGDRDHTVHPRNGEALIGQHVGRNTRASIDNGSVPGGHSFTRTLHRNSDGAAVAEHWLIHGAGHAWSGGSKSGTYTDRKGPPATREMMRFFTTR